MFGTTKAKVTTGRRVAIVLATLAIVLSLPGSAMAYDLFIKLNYSTGLTTKVWNQSSSDVCGNAKMTMTIYYGPSNATSVYVQKIVVTETAGTNSDIGAAWATIYAENGGYSVTIGDGAIGGAKGYLGPNESKTWTYTVGKTFSWATIGKLHMLKYYALRPHGTAWIDQCMKNNEAVYYY